MRPTQVVLKDDPLWFKDAVIYQLHVKTFLDTDGNGVGDFQGLLKKLDYLQDLGVTAIWLLPFYPSPLKDDGYDIADYFDVHADYGTIKDFREFLKSAHYRGIRVITELVLNHTSDQHRWFQMARRSHPDSEIRNYYVWSHNPNMYQDARIIFSDFETSNWTWDPMAKAYYWHRFYSHQPDLNFDNPKIQKEMFKILDFWFDMGVDGLRLDAIPYLFEREGTNCENLPETHEFLKKLRSYVDKHYKNRLLLAEANQWPEDAAAYFGNDDECNMAFHFPIMPRLFMSLWMEDRFPIIDILEQTPAIPQGSQWAMFLRNHDELTLEMVTDEERDYMYRIYAKDPRARINLGIRRRLAPLMNNNRRKIELLNFLLFSLPGTPIIYYGDEIGMGDNYYLGDRNGVRTPMQWSPDRNAGFSSTNPQHVYLPVILDPEYHYEVVNVENQEKNFSSLLWWMRRIIAMRKRLQALSRGETEFLYPDNPKVLTFIRKFEEEQVLVIINLSRFAQVAELDLSAYAGCVPVEVFSGNRFPVIKDTPYMFTLGIHDYFWFSLHRDEEFHTTLQEWTPRQITLKGHWRDLFQGKDLDTLQSDILPGFIRSRRWFRSKARTIRMVQIKENIPISKGEQTHYLLLVEVFYTEGDSEIYLLPLSVLPEKEAAAMLEQAPQAVLAHIQDRDAEAILYDSVYSQQFRELLFELIVHKKKIQGSTGHIEAYPSKTWKHPSGQNLEEGSSRVLKAEQSNTSILYGSEYFLKLYRKVEEGINPDTEISSYLTEKQGFANISPFLGPIQYRRSKNEITALGMLQHFIPNQGDAWSFALDNLEHYFERILTQKVDQQEIPATAHNLFSISFENTPQVMVDFIGGYFLEMIDLLGQVTGQFHLALGREQEDEAFAPETFSKLYQRSVYQSMRSLVRRTLYTLNRNLAYLDQKNQESARDIIKFEDLILQTMAKITEKKIQSQKIRIHGDYHLGQVLYTGNNFIIIDFEGEPARPLSERRLKRSCFKDVAGMVRSFHYASYSALFKQASIRPQDVSYLQNWIYPWYRTVSGIFLDAYMRNVQGAAFIPENQEELEFLFNLFLLEKAVYEIGYELNNRPQWISLPIEGIKEILDLKKK